jgi:hypothetical protein
MQKSLGAVLTGIPLVFAGRENFAVAQAMSYGLCAVIVSIGVSSFLSDRGIRSQDIWRWGMVQSEGPKPWLRGDGASDSKFFLSALFGATGGLALGLFARG